MRTTDRHNAWIAPALLSLATALLKTVSEMRSAARFVARSARCLFWVALVLSFPTSAMSADKKVPEKTMLIMNVKIFDGTSETLITGTGGHSYGQHDHELFPQLLITFQGMG